MTPFAQNVTTIIALGTVFVDICIVVFALFYIVDLFSDRTKKSAHKHDKKSLLGFVQRNALGLGTLAAGAAVIGSLIYSSIIGFVPCELCWWHRIFLFPQAVIFLIAWIRSKWSKNTSADSNIFWYSLILSIIGSCIAIFHYYGQMFNPGALAACEVAGVSCAKIYFVSFGYITIPMMSLSIFLLLILISLIRLRNRH